MTWYVLFNQGLYKDPYSQYLSEASDSSSPMFDPHQVIVTMDFRVIALLLLVCVFSFTEGKSLLLKTFDMILIHCYKPNWSFL